MDGMVTPLAQPRERLLTPRTGKPGLGPALLLAAAAIHAALIAACCLLLITQPVPPPPPETGMQVVFAPPAPATTTILATAPLEPQALPVIATLAPVPPIAIVPGAATPHPRIARPPRRPAPPRPPRQDATIATASPAPPVPTAPPRPVPAASLAGWEARIRQAVQDAAIYPAAARLQHRQGRAGVQFAYASGAVSAVTVTQSSQSAVLDEAAMEAVTRAKMPPPPPELGPQNRTMLVWVQFTLTAED